MVQRAQVLVSDIIQTCGHGSQFIKRPCQTFFSRNLCLVFTLVQYCLYLYVDTTPIVLQNVVDNVFFLPFFFIQELPLCEVFSGLIFVYFLGGVCKDRVKSLFPRCFFEKGKVLELMFLPLFSDNLRIASTS